MGTPPSPLGFGPNNIAINLESGIVQSGGSGPSILSGTVDPSATATSATKGSIYQNSSNANVYLKTDNGSSTNWSSLGQSSIVTAWVAYTPTLTNFGTATNVNFYSRRVGDSLEIQGFFTSGTAVASLGAVTIGYNGVSGNVSIDSLKLPASVSGSYSVVGSAGSNNSQSSFTVLASSDDALLRFGVGSTNSGVQPINGATLTGTGVAASFFARVPISGWAAAPVPTNAGVVSDWIAYTPTISSNGTFPTNTTTFFYRQVGDSIEIDGFIQLTGTAVSWDSPTWTLPAGLAMDSSKSPLVGNSGIFNTGDFSATGSGAYQGASQIVNTTTFKLVQGGQAGSYTGITQAAPASFTSGGYFIVQAYGLPIVGWTSNQLVVNPAPVAANLVLAGPTSGGSATPTYRALVAADIPAGGSGIVRSIISVTSTISGAAVAGTDYVYLIGASGVYTQPTAVGNTNRYTLKNVDSSNKTISFTGGQTGDGSSTLTLTPNTVVDLISDNSNWKVI